MSYVKQNFASGQKLKAAQLNYVEDGIVNLETEIARVDASVDSLETSIPKTLPNPKSLTIGDITYDGSKAVNIAYTDLTRSQQVVTVNCYGLVPGEEYEIHLYTASRRRGNAKNLWRHPSNTNEGVNFTGKGYARLAGEKYASNSKTGTVLYPDVPDWMPNGGILQTEWAFTATDTIERVNIDLCTWLLPMLKPINCDWSDGCAFIGIGVTHSGSPKRSVTAPLIMRFAVVRKSTGEIGHTMDTLRVGRPRGQLIYVGDNKGTKMINSLYSSIV